MTSKEFVLDTLRRTGRTAALALQERSASMTGTELYAEEDYIPDFASACAKMNMLSRSIGFVCKSSAGHVVKLLQPYDSSVFTAEPEELPAQWGFQWSQDPRKARPFVSLTTSPYQTGDCCTYEGHVWKSGQDNNTWAPGTINVSWEDLGPVPA